MGIYVNTEYWSEYPFNWKNIGSYAANSPYPIRGLSVTSLQNNNFSKCAIWSKD